MKQRQMEGSAKTLILGFFFKMRKKKMGIIIKIHAEWCTWHNCNWKCTAVSSPRVTMCCELHQCRSIKYNSIKYCVCPLKLMLMILT